MYFYGCFYSSKVTGRDNSEQGLLSTTYVMDIEYKVQVMNAIVLP